MVPLVVPLVVPVVVITVTVTYPMRNHRCLYHGCLLGPMMLYLVLAYKARAVLQWIQEILLHQALSPGGGWSCAADLAGERVMRSVGARCATQLKRALR